MFDQLLTDFVPNEVAVRQLCDPSLVEPSSVDLSRQLGVFRRPDEDGELGVLGHVLRGRAAQQPAADYGHIVDQLLFWRNLIKFYNG